MSAAHDQAAPALTYKKLLSFFLPLGASASLMAVSPVIINSTLARSSDPAAVISSFAVAMSLMALTETPAVVFRKASSALVRDRHSFRAVLTMAVMVMGTVMALDISIAYSPFGRWVFGTLLGVDPHLMSGVILAYRFLMFASIFSGIRCLFQGVIIVNLRTTWLTIGTAVRLAGMLLIAGYLVSTDQVTTGAAGAFLFCAGMFIEAGMSLIKGRSIVARLLPERLEDHGVRERSHVAAFYFPLLYAALLTALLGPVMNAFLSKAGDRELAIASYAIAGNLAWLTRSFFFYMHQIVIQFFPVDAGKVFRFNLGLSLAPVTLTAVLGFTPFGAWFLSHVMGIQGGTALMTEILRAVRVFLIVNAIFPWLDYANGLLMLRGRTKVMSWSQVAFMGLAVPTLLVLTILVPEWNGMIGAAAQSAGFAGATAVVFGNLIKSGEPLAPVRSRTVRFRQM